VRGATSAPTERVLDVLELLGRPDGRRLRFSDIVTELGLTQATAHAILKTLCDRGWLSRDPMDKTFALGPALAVVAAQAETARPLAHATRVAAQQLSQQLGYPASVIERHGDELVIVAFEGHGGPAKVPGDRIRYAPPFGVAFAAWDGDSGRREWIGRAPSSVDGLAERLDQVLSQTRDRGYDVDWTTPALTLAAQVVGTLPADGLPEHVRDITDQLLAEFTTMGLQQPGGAAQPVATIAAPVFGARGEVALILSVHPLRPMTARQVDAAGRKVMRAAELASRTCRS
jgi:DNA-binding IclR family transcriptional regulator